MNQTRGIFVVGIFLLGFALLAPGGDSRPGWAFWQVVRASSWDRFFEWPAMWCSFRLLVGSLAGFLILDSLATVFLRWRQKVLAGAVLGLICVPCAGYLTGIYYFLRALL